MVRHILCVAEKPSVARQVAAHLNGGQASSEAVRGSQYVKNLRFDFDFGPPWGRCNVVMTSVLGHLYGIDFPPSFRDWSIQLGLFDAPVVPIISDQNKALVENIRQNARNAQALFIWTDCDREGENIGAEVRKAARETNRSIEVKRAQFSNYEAAHIIQAARRPVDLDDLQAKAVDARQEIDLRLGAAFTRFTTKLLQRHIQGENADRRVISYGTCQFPTLGFVVDRYFKVKNFKPEKFWKIEVMQKRDEITVGFSWVRHRLFDRQSVITIYERCLKARLAKVTKVQRKPTSRWRPLPLTTVELQKLGSSYLRLSSARVMAVAETLYREGWISYPRTETDQFDTGFDLKRYIERQVPDRTWGGYSQGLLDGAFMQPRAGNHNDKAHPPIHPVLYKDPSSMGRDERLVYEFVVRRFLACCSRDAKGELTSVEILYGPETFTATGLLVLEKNYLEIYKYERWTGNQPLPRFTLHETFEPTEALLKDGQTSVPTYLTEPELISLMDANGIGTDATMATHIKKIQDREYIQGLHPTDESTPTTTTRGRGGRGSRRARGGRNANAGASDRAVENTTSTARVQQFIPTTLGVALIEGYDSIGLETSLSRPFLRREMEDRMREICTGVRGQEDTVRDVLAQYRAVFTRAAAARGTLEDVARRYLCPSES